MVASCDWLARIALVCVSVATLFLFTELLKPQEDFDFYALEGGEVVALKSLHNGKYLEVHAGDGKVYATAADGHGYAAQWRVLVLDAATVQALSHSAQQIDRHSELFTGRKMVTSSGCQCSGFSNAHGFGRFCHPWETDDQEPWCYVNASCTSDSARGSFGKRYESCAAMTDYSNHAYDELRDSERFGPNDYNESAPDPWRGGGEPVLRPLSGCNCSGFQNTHGFGGSCKGWEFAGQTPWCYIPPDCKGAAVGEGDAVTSGSFGQPFEDCIETWSDWLPSARGRRLAQTAAASPEAAPGATAPAEPTSAEPAPAELAAAGPTARRSGPRRRLLAPSRLTQMLAAAPEEERLLVLINRQSRAFLKVEPPPHRDALQLTARSDALSIRSVFSSFERTHMLLAYATNSLVNLCDDDGAGAVCTGTHEREADPLKLLRTPKSTARWTLEVVPAFYSQPRPAYTPPRPTAGW